MKHRRDTTAMDDKIHIIESRGDKVDKKYKITYDSDGY